MIDIKKILKTSIPFLLVLFFLLNLPINANAENSLTIPRWLIESKILENGDLYIEEDITFDFSGDFNGVFRDIVLTNTNGIKDIQVSEMVKGKEVKYTKVKQGQKGDNKVFEIGNNFAPSNEIKIYSPSHDEQKTFRVKYTVKDVAVKYNDTSELYYKFLGSENKTPIDYFSVNIELPQNRTDKVKIFAHGPLNGDINFKYENLIHIEVKNVPSDTFIEGRILFPNKFIPKSYNLISKDSYDEIINEEIAFQKEIKENAIKKEKRKDIFNYISLIVGGIDVIFLALLMLHLRREVNIYERVKHSPVPNDCTPAVASYLYYYDVSSNAIMATILDLTRKGYLDIEDGGQYKRKTNNLIIRKTKNPDEKLLPQEKYFMNWLLNIISNGEKVETKKIEHYAKKHYTKFWEEYVNWKKKVKEDAIDKGYFDNSNQKLEVFVVLLSSASMTISIISLIFGSMYAFFPLFASIFGLIYGITLFYRKSDLGYSEYKKWQDFMKYMKENKTDLEKEIFKYPLDISLIYALALGVDRKILNKYKIYTEQNHYTNNWVYWYFLSSSSRNNTFDRSINNAFGSVSSSSSSGSNIGSGGGFSGGGGGGAGGGGAGGF